MDDLLSTTAVGWVLGRSPASIRRMIRDGSVDGVRIPAGFRVPKAEVMRLAREHIEREAGHKLGDDELERLIDRVITTNEGRT